MSSWGVVVVGNHFLFHLQNAPLLWIFKWGERGDGGSRRPWEESLHRAPDLFALAQK